MDFALGLLLGLSFTALAFVFGNELGYKQGYRHGREIGKLDGLNTVLDMALKTLTENKPTKKPKAKK